MTARRTEIGTVAGLTLLAGLLRFPFLSTQSFWSDEIYTRWIVAHHGLSTIWSQIRTTESTPPLYYLLAKLSGDLSGNLGPFALRLPSALALTLAVPVAYLAVRRLVSPPVALVAAALVAVNPTLVIYGTDARSYGLFVLCGLLSIWTFAGLLDERATPTGYALWAFASAAALWTHYFAIFLVLAEVAVLLILRADGRVELAVSAALIAVLTIPLIPLALHQAHGDSSAFIAAMPLSHRVSDTIRQFAMGSNVPRTWLEGVGLVLLYGAVALGCWTARHDRGERILCALVALTVGLPLLGAVVHLEDRFYMRNLIIAIPLLVTLAAPALIRRRGRALLAAILLTMTVTAVWVASDWRYGEPDWHGAVGALTSAERHEPLLAIEPGGYPFAPTSVYLDRRPQTAPLRSTQLLLIVAPNRPAHSRALVPVDPPPPIRRQLGGFEVQRTATVHGFRIEQLTSRAPQTVPAPAVSDGALYR